MLSIAFQKVFFYFFQKRFAFWKKVFFSFWKDKPCAGVEAEANPCAGSKLPCEEIFFQMENSSMLSTAFQKVFFFFQKYFYFGKSFSFWIVQGRR